MIVEKIVPLTKRCSRKTRSSGTGTFNERKGRCAHWALYSVDKIPLCGIHAGEAALKHLLQEQT